MPDHCKSYRTGVQLIVEFTYAQDDSKDGDEQDIEILSSSIFEPLPNGTPAGVQLNNWDVSSFQMRIAK